MRLQFKFRENAAEAARRQLVAALDEHGATVRPLFPGETDSELAALYVVEASNEELGRRLLALLNTSREVEFAEAEVRRKPMRTWSDERLDKA